MDTFDGFVPGLVVGAMLVCFGMSVSVVSVHDSKETGRRALRSAQACRPAGVLNAERGIATCSDGRVFRWREGYLTPVGRK